MRHRRAEDRHHRVADELLDRTPMALELGAQLGVVRGQDRPNILGVVRFGLGGRADEIGEEDRDDLPLLENLRTGAVEWCAASGAKGRVARAFATARRTDD